MRSEPRFVAPWSGTVCRMIHRLATTKRVKLQRAREHTKPSSSLLKAKTFYLRHTNITECLHPNLEVFLDSLSSYPYARAFLGGLTSQPLTLSHFAWQMTVTLAPQSSNLDRRLDTFGLRMHKQQLEHAWLGQSMYNAPGTPAVCHLVHRPHNH